MVYEEEVILGGVAVNCPECGEAMSTTIDGRFIVCPQEHFAVQVSR
jgi:hypothetical protein